MRDKRHYPEELKAEVIEYCISNTIMDASKKYGIQYPTVYTWVRNAGKTDMVKRHEHAGQVTRDDIVERMAVLQVISPPGFAWSSGEIAEVIGVSRSAVSAMTRTALRKAYKRIKSTAPDLEEWGVIR